MQGLSNTQIAEIYADMMSGDRTALFKLQQVASHHQRPTKPPSASHPAMSQSKQDAMKEVTSMPSMPASKEDLFLNAIKQGAKFTALRKERQNRPKQFRFVNSSNDENSDKDKTLFRDKQAKEAEPPLPDKSKINNRPYALPRVHHQLKEHPETAKTHSTELETMKKEEVKKKAKEGRGLKQLQKSKIVLKKERVDFKEIIGKNKRMREQFERLNQEQRQIQSSILEYHNQTIEQLAKATSKFCLNLNNPARYLKRKKSASPQRQQTQSQKKLSPFRAAMKTEGERCGEIEAELAHLKSMLSSNDRRLRQLQRERESLLFVRYLQRYGTDIMEEEQEEQDTVQPLEQNSRDRNHYKYSMAKTREKKWSLIQRTQYDAQRTHSLEESRKVSSVNRTSKEDDDSVNKVTVNQRLKNMLFS